MILTGVKKQLGDFSLCIDKLVISKPGIYGLMGPNGSGKTTLAKIIAGLQKPDIGVIDMEGLRPVSITYLDAKPYMMDDSVSNNLVYPLKLRGVKPDAGQIAAYLEMMKFSSREKNRATRLSGGERQKLALLRAVIFKPAFIIADEAMTAMDADALELFEKIILEQQKKENQIWIIISHRMSQIKRLCDTVFTMDNGMINETSDC